MRILLTAINSKYIHSNLAVYSLKAYHNMHTNGSSQVSLAEYTINQPVDYYVADIYRKKPDVVAFSCYIWNIMYVYEAVAQLKKVMPDVKIWLGGPEVSFDAHKLLRENENIDGVMCGEGEVTFSKLANSGFNTKAYAAGEINIDGIVYRNGNEICKTQPVECIDMDELPFVYENLEAFKNKIIYYESSRGCPFGCSYCLSSVEKNVRFRSLPLVFKELKFFLDNNVSQVKFVDRTFNCNHDRSVKLLEYIADHDNGITNFHFEIAADLLRDDEIELLKSLRPGLVQLEIGVQSTNIDTIHHINRVMDFNHLSKVVRSLNMGKNVHLHLDLIAGLPKEDLASFHNSFNDVFALEPEQLQVGFLKVLKGSPMAKMEENYELVYKPQPPYEIMKTKWLSYDDILHLKEIEDMVEVYYNSGQYTLTIKILVNYSKDAYVLFEMLAQYYSRNNLWNVKHSRITRYEILYSFINEYVKDNHICEILKELLIFDLYLRENLKSRPAFAEPVDYYRNQVHQLYTLSKAPKNGHIERFSKNFSDYIDEYISTENIHISIDNTKDMCDYTWILFDYQSRDPLNYNCSVYRLNVSQENGD